MDSLFDIEDGVEENVEESISTKDCDEWENFLNAKETQILLWSLEKIAYFFIENILNVHLFSGS